MIYRVFDSSLPQGQIAEITDPSWPLIKEGERIPLTVNNKDGLYIVTRVGAFNRNTDNKLVVDLWVKDYFSKAK